MMMIMRATAATASSRQQCCRHRHPRQRNSSLSYQLLVCISFYLCQQQQQHVVHAERSMSASSLAAASPIPNWEPSWIASAAHGLSIAISCRPSDDEECVILLLQSSKSSSDHNDDNNDDHFAAVKDSATSIDRDDDEQQQQKQHDDKKSYYGLSLMTSKQTRSSIPRVSSSSSSSSLSQRWIRLGANAMGTMTGLYSDVDHVQKVLQRQLEGHVALYAEEGMPIARLVRLLSTMLQSATRYHGGRPYAIQSMLIGASTTTTTTTATSTTATTTTSSSSSSSLLAIYTLDPSGGWLHFESGAAAIGRLAPQARAKLFQLLFNKKDDNDMTTQQQLRVMDPQQTLQLAMRVMLETLEGDFPQEQQLLQQPLPLPSPNSFEAVIMRKKRTSRHCQVALVNPTQVEQCHRKVWSEWLHHSSSSAEQNVTS